MNLIKPFTQFLKENYNIDLNEVKNVLATAQHILTNTDMTQYLKSLNGGLSAGLECYVGSATWSIQDDDGILFKKYSFNQRHTDRNQKIQDTMWEVFDTEKQEGIGDVKFMDLVNVIKMSKTSQEFEMNLKKIVKPASR